MSDREFFLVCCLYVHGTTESATRPPWYSRARFNHRHGNSVKFIHQREHLNEGDMVVIESSNACNIRLMSDANFRSFKNGGRHTYHGGAFDRFPAKIVVPSTGFWNITLDTVTQ